MANKTRPLPKDFLDWQVRLRRRTMVEHNGAPQMGVVPTVSVTRAEGQNGVVSHSIVCGILPSRSLLDAKTREFREAYEGTIERGARAAYDAGIALLRDYYESSAAFDPESITTLLPKDAPLVLALRANPACALVFNVFETGSARGGAASVRCTQIDARADVLEAGPVFENVWWHNTLFHGKADDHVVVHFRHERSWDTRFGGFVPLD
jgi:hypothetical protein